MKLNKFTLNHDYVFTFNFENGLEKTVDISSLIKDKVNVESLKTAHIDSDWGCLEFDEGAIDIEPKTLYNFVLLNIEKQA